MIWLIGNKGMLGTELSLLLKKNNISFIGTDKEIDITSINSLEKYVKNKSINWIINCAAYTSVDKAEYDIEFCSTLNTDGPYNIAVIANKINANIIHISTDYVFNGKGNKSYTEDDSTDPIGVYGLTKRDGEFKILQGNNKSYIIRTSWLYGKYGNNFVHTMLKLMNERDTISVVNDQTGTPTWANDLAQVIIKFIVLSDSGKTIPYGIYHFSNEGTITWYDFAREIYSKAKVLGILTKDCEIKPCSSSDFPSKVTRPAYSVLDKTKIKKELGITIPSWDESLELFLKSKD
ncbi:MAG: dTDP-4-dehydrorhamnose reductase [Treponema sp.]|nr:dTDP-4-dehydrorhamnose reductase [Treponema sp.]